MNADLFRKLAALGLDTEQIAGVLELMDAEAEERKEKGRARWRKWKENQPTNVSKRLPTTANVSSQLAGVEDSSSKKDISGKEEKKESAAKPRGLDDFKAELSSILDSERIDAIVAVRRKKGATFSALAGRSLSKALCSWPNVNEAADEMVLRNWTGFKAEWMDKRSTGPPRRRNYADVAMDKLAGKTNGSEGIFGNNGDAQRLPAGRIESRPDDGNLLGGIGRRIVQIDH